MFVYLPWRSFISCLPIQNVFFLEASFSAERTWSRFRDGGYLWPLTFPFAGDFALARQEVAGERRSGRGGVGGLMD